MFGPDKPAQITLADPGRVHYVGFLVERLISMKTACFGMLHNVCILLLFNINYTGWVIPKTLNKIQIAFLHVPGNALRLSTHWCLDKYCH